MADTEARLKVIGARNEAAKRGAYPGDIHAGFRLLRRDVEFLIEQNSELRRVLSNTGAALAIADPKHVAVGESASLLMALAAKEKQ